MRRIAAAMGLATGLTLLAYWSLDAFRALLIGWAQFLIRVVPQLDMDWRTSLAALIVFILSTLGVHWFAQAAWKARGSVHHWKFNWSLSAILIVIVSFAAGICMIGVTHQTGWLLTSKQPAIVVTEKVPYQMNKSSRDQIRCLLLGLNNADEFSNSAGHKHSWATLAILGTWYSGCNDSGECIDLNLPWNDPKNRPLFRCTVNLLINPEFPGAPIRDADGYGLAQYAGNSRALENGAIRPFKQFADGTANTLLIGEVNANFRPWGDPANVRDPARGINRSPHGFGGPPGTHGALFGMADGSVRFVSERVTPAVLRALATSDGGEPADLNVLEKR